jgi:hypothetical protein
VRGRISDFLNETVYLSTRILELTLLFAKMASKMKQG